MITVTMRLNESFGQEEINSIFIFEFFRAQPNRGMDNLVHFLNNYSRQKTVIWLYQFNTFVRDGEVSTSAGTLFAGR